MKLKTLLSNQNETADFLNNDPTPFVLPGFNAPKDYQLLVSVTKNQDECEIQTICLIYFGREKPEIIFKIRIVVRNVPSTLLFMRNCVRLVVWRKLCGEHSGILSGFAGKA